jgi:transposase
MCDLEKGQVVDLLPDRDAQTVAGWLREHPGIEIVARDRAGAYVDAVRQGAPGGGSGRGPLAPAAQLHRSAPAGARPSPRRVRARCHDGSAEAALRPEHGSAAKADERRQQRHADREGRFKEATDLARAGLGVRAITRALGLSRNTVRRWLRSDAAPTWRKGKRARLIDPFLPYLRQRLSEGMPNAAQLWREIRKQGYPGQVVAVRAAVVKLRSGPARLACSAVWAGWRRPTTRQTARALLSDAESTGPEKRFHDTLLGSVPEIRRAVAEARTFGTLVRERRADALDPWLTQAKDGPLSGFAEGLRRDRAAVMAALVHPWSTGPVEGRINRLKLIKRQGYGRAGCDLLRARVLAA